MSPDQSKWSVRVAGTRIVQRATTGKLTEIGGQCGAGVDLIGRPASDVQEQPAQRTAGHFDVDMPRPRARVGVVMVAAVDPATHQLLIVAVHPFRVPVATDSAGLSLARLARAAG
uniref:hypothetical protein n=1 Tax=Streptomyces antimycoticus TaxID=68175 RepID=UPI003B2237B6